MVIRRIRARSILVRSSIPGFDFAVNPYRGCQHACRYCYAEFMVKYMERAERWGSFVEIKENAEALLYRELPRAFRKRIILSSVTDPYQPVEASEKKTRALLRLLIGAEPELWVLTKSPLILRDLDLLKDFHRAAAGFTVTVLGPESRLIEPSAPPPFERIKALEKLSACRLETFLFAAPLLPGLSDTPENLSRIFELAERAGVRQIYFDRLSLYSYVERKLLRLYRNHFPEKLPLLLEYRSKRRTYLKRKKELILRLASGKKLDVVLFF